MNKNWKKPFENEKDVIETWDLVADDYDYHDYISANDSKANYEHIFKALSNKINGKSFLEVGCGSAFMSFKFAEKGAKISLLDISMNVLEKAKVFFNKNKTQFYNIYCNSALDIKEKNKKFDVVWNAGVIEHFHEKDQIKMIDEMYRLTKPGGYFIIQVPNSNCIPYQIWQYLLKITNKWPYGYQKDISPNKLSYLIKKSNKKEPFECYSYNPVLGFLLLPGFRKITKLLGFDKLKFHSKKSFFGSVTISILKKSF